MTAVFDSTFNAGSTTMPPYTALVASVDTAEAIGFLDSDEVSFILNAETEIRLCTSYSEVNDTISSLINQYNSIAWQPSISHGVEAYEYLSIAKHSSAFWGQPGDTILTIAAHPLESDEDAYIEAYNKAIAMGMSTDEATEYAAAVAAAASEVIGTGNDGNGNGGGGNGGGGNGGGGNGGGGGILTEIVAVSLLIIYLIFA